MLHLGPDAPLKSSSRDTDERCEDSPAAARSEVPAPVDLLPEAGNDDVVAAVGDLAQLGDRWPGVEGRRSGGRTSSALGNASAFGEATAIFPEAQSRNARARVSPREMGPTGLDGSANLGVAIIRGQLCPVA